MAAPTNPPRASLVERVNVNLPRPLLDDLRRLVPRSRRSEVIARATARELRRLKLAALFQDFKHGPLWETSDHPELNTGGAVDAAVNQLRASGMLRAIMHPAQEAKLTTAHKPRARRKARRE